MAAEGKIHSRMASADANVLAGASDTKDEIQGSAEPEGEELGDGEEVAIERTREEL